MDETEVPLCVIQIGHRDGKIEKSLYQIVSTYALSKGWVDNGTLEFWYNKISQAWADNLNGSSELLLDFVQSLNARYKISWTRTIQCNFNTATLHFCSTTV